jgi:hypothetical protein
MSKGIRSVRKPLRDVVTTFSYYTLYYPTEVSFLPTLKPAGCGNSQKEKPDSSWGVSTGE